MKHLVLGVVLVLFAATALADAPQGIATADGQDQRAAARRGDETQIDFPDGLPRISKVQIRPLGSKCQQTLCSSFEFCFSEGTQCMVGASTQSCQIAEGPRDPHGSCACRNC